MEKRTYITRMPDKAGAFLVAGRIIAAHNGNIVRVNYNKAVDTHTLFIEVAAESAQHQLIKEHLLRCGYLSTNGSEARIIMIVLTLDDRPGAVLPVLEIINAHNVNISYISSQENGTGVQHFKMGLFIEDTSEIKSLIDSISKVCEINILDYEVTDRLLDGTVFYITFANKMRSILGLTQGQTNDVLVLANSLMQILDEHNKPQIKTFDYIRRFAQFVREHKGERFAPSVSRNTLADGVTLYTIEPPCGSNTFVLECADGLLFVDSGFACYRDEMVKLFENLFVNYHNTPKIAFLTHSDMDHAGILSEFDRIYMSSSSYDDFCLDIQGDAPFREQNPLHAPYCRLSRIISEYAPPPIEKCVALAPRNSDDELLQLVGNVSFGGYNFDFYEGPGGHIRGESVIVSPQLRILFCGDIYVNIKGFSDQQREFNILAPFLMTGVDSDSALAKQCRQHLVERFSGYLFCPGHGAAQIIA